MNRKLFIMAAVCGGLGLLQSANAATIINAGGTVALGVNPEGHLNTRDTYGYAPNAPGFVGVTSIGLGDATSPGCQCEGWGVSASGFSGFANVSVDGVNNLTVDSFVTDDVGSGAGSFAISKVHVTSLPGLKVTQSYAVAGVGHADRLFRDRVTIENTTGGSITDVRYVRVMDWDVPPTEFSEYVTIAGTATTANLEKSHNNGFNTANPLADLGALSGGTTDVDFTDVGPADHGAYFRFNFGTLLDGESKTFDIFYGASANEALALASLGAVGAELYSLGQNNHPSHNDETTFAFGFKGVGGVIIVPPPPGVPDAGSTLSLLGLGFACLAGLKRIRK